MKRYFFALILLISLPALALASHTREEFDFDDGQVPTNWSGSKTTDGSPFGGRYLGSFSGGSDVGWFVLDALPPDSGTHDDRQVQLQFDVVNFDPFTENFVVSGVAGDGSFNFGLTAADIVSGSGSNFSFFLTFVLYDVDGCCTDMGINFLKESPGDWGLDNVIIDWTTAVPLPAAGWLMALALATLFAARKRSA